MESMQRSIEEAAQRLLGAQESGTPAEPVRELIGATDIDLAYRVQQQVIAARLAGGAKVVGRKIGLTSKAVQEQVGVDQPDFGFLLDEMSYADGETIPYSSLLQPRAEVEIAFVLAAPIADVADPEEVRAAVDYAVAAIEVVASRVRDWDIKITDTVADNASSGAFVLGAERVALADFDPPAVTMSLTRAGEEISSGTGAACLGDPLNALAWLAEAAARYGSPLGAGDVVLSGALGPLAVVFPGDELTASISSLGTVTARFDQGG
ncbi:MAG TPA: fumarylacetoacetate hydrolase family protein [Solirubrobacterales bacterium]|nr:fumarylacetoacetate hydrolase family protein [Solirubrobacterales bacterium]